MMKSINCAIDFERVPQTITKEAELCLSLANKAIFQCTVVVVKRTVGQRQNSANNILGPGCQCSNNSKTIGVMG